MANPATIAQGTNSTPVNPTNWNVLVDQINALTDRVFDVKDYGATGDGVTDDIAAFDLAVVDALVTGGEIHIPAGTYLLSTKLDLTGGNLISIRGVGEASIIRFTGATDGIFFEHTTGGLWGPHISNIKIETSNASGSASIHLTQAGVFPGFGSAQQGAIIENVQIRLSGAGAWDYGLRTHFCLESVARSLHMYDVGDVAGVVLEGEASAASNSWHFEDLRVRGTYAIGLWSRGSTALSISGGTMEGAPSVCNIRLQRMPGLTNAPGGHISGMHFENTTAVPCIDLDHALGMVITGCRLDTGAGADCINIGNSAPAFFLSTATGGSGTTVVDAGVNFVTNGVAVGDIVWNNTDGCRGIVTTVAANTLTCSAGFTGGTNDDFENLDNYRVNSDQCAGVVVKGNNLTVGGITIGDLAYDTEITNNRLFEVTITDSGVRTSLRGNQYGAAAGFDLEGAIKAQWFVAGSSLAELVLQNTTHEDGDGGRESTLRFKGEQSGGQITTLALIEASHDGAADDEKGQLNIKVNDTNDGDSPSITAVNIESTGNTIIGKQLVAGNVNFAADAEASDTYVITLSPAPTAYTTGMPIAFTANTANTGACTVNVNALGAKSLKVLNDRDPGNGYIESGSVVTAVYDGTNFQITSLDASKPDYAGIFVNDNAVATTVLLVDAFEPITVFDTDMPEVVSNGANGTDNITVGTTGDYEVAFSAFGESAGVNKDYEMYAFEIAASGDTISGATQANPCVLTATGHSFSNGNRVKISGLGGMTELNGQIYTVANAGANDFELNDDNGGNIDSTGYGAYASTGTAFLATCLLQCHTHRRYAGPGDVGASGSSGIASLTSGNTMELHVKCVTDSSDITLEALQFSIIRL